MDTQHPIQQVNDILTGNDKQDRISAIFAYYFVFGCPLCGEYHAPIIHATVSRRSYDYEDDSMHQTYSLVVICTRRREKDLHPYSRRIGPD
jgi:hypothetical protein